MEKKININYEGGAAAMPVALLKCIESASKTDIRILVAALSCASMGGFASEEVIRLAGVDEKQLSASIKFWTEKGLFSESAAAETEEIGTKTEDTPSSCPLFWSVARRRPILSTSARDLWVKCSIPMR